MENNLIVIENGQLNIYLLDNQVVWEVGRMVEGAYTGYPDACNDNQP